MMSARKNQIDLPVPVKDNAYWRVNFRPEDYISGRLDTLSECLKVVEKNRLNLRGWDYPHLGHDNEREFGGNYLASWTDFLGNIEYWRLYKSGQFIHLFSVRENTKEEWKKESREAHKKHLSFRTDLKNESPPGYVSVTNLVYTITEIFEFAARLCQSEFYQGNIEIDISLKKVKGFVLVVSLDRLWIKDYSAKKDVLRYHELISSKKLLSNSADQSLSVIRYFLERFGWVDPPSDSIKNDQNKLLGL